MKLVKIGEIGDTEIMGLELKGSDISRIVSLVIGILGFAASVSLIVKWFTDGESFKFFAE